MGQGENSAIPGPSTSRSTRQPQRTRRHATERPPSGGEVSDEQQSYAESGPPTESEEGEARHSPNHARGSGNPSREPRGGETGDKTQRKCTEVKPSGYDRSQLTPGPDQPRAKRAGDRGVTAGSNRYDDFQLRIRNGIKTAILRTISRSPPESTPNAVIKTMAASVPVPKYGGDDDLEVFMKWLQELLAFIDLHQIVGRRNDYMRILTLGSALEGRALSWYNLNLRGPLRLEPNSFLDMVIHVSNEFITPAAATKAEEANSYLKLWAAFTNGISVPEVFTRLHTAYGYATPTTEAREAVLGYGLTRRIIVANAKGMKKDSVKAFLILLTTLAREMDLIGTKGIWSDILKRVAPAPVDNWGALTAAFTSNLLWARTDFGIHFHRNSLPSHGKSPPVGTGTHSCRCC